MLDANVPRDVVPGGGRVVAVTALEEFQDFVIARVRHQSLLPIGAIVAERTSEAKRSGEMRHKMPLDIALTRGGVVAERAFEGLHTTMNAGVFSHFYNSEMVFLTDPLSALTTNTRMDICCYKATIAISAFEVLEAIVAILVLAQIALMSESLAVLMAYKGLRARVEAMIVSNESVLLIGRVMTSIALVPLSANGRCGAFLITFQDLIAPFIE